MHLSIYTIQFHSFMRMECNDNLFMRIAILWQFVLKQFILFYIFKGIVFTLFYNVFMFTFLRHFQFHLFIHSFIHLFIHSFINLFIYLFNYSFYSFIYLFICLFDYSFMLMKCNDNFWQCCWWRVWEWINAED